MFLQYLSSREGHYFNKILPKFLNQWENRRCPYTDPYDIELWEIENMLTEKDRKERKNNPINLGEGKTEEWKHRYYDYHFAVNGDQKKLVDDVSYEYIKGLLWVTKYYFKGCPSYSWQYPYLHAPFVSDLHDYVKNNNIDVSKIILVDHGSLSPCQQLLAVLPPSCSELIPDTYKHLVEKKSSPIIDFYPQKIHLDRCYKYKEFQCIPLIPIVDPMRIKSATEKLKLSKDEKIRNEILGEIENNYN